MFFMPAEDEAHVKIAPSLGIVLGVTFVAVLGLGILPGQLIQWASDSAQFLIQF